MKRLLDRMLLGLAVALTIVSCSPEPTEPPFTKRQIRRWNNQLTVVWEISGITMSYINAGRIQFAVDCEANRERVRSQIDEILADLDIPPKAVTLVVSERERILEEPPPFSCAPPEVIDPVTGLSLPGFGGMYTLGASTYIYMLEPSQEAAEELVFTIAGRDPLDRVPNVRAVQGDYTWQQLLEWRGLLTSSMEQIPGVDYWSDMDFLPDPKRNRLTLNITGRQFDADVIADIEGMMERLGVPQGAVVLLERAGERLVEVEKR